MDLTNLLYSCNVTVSPSQYETQIAKIGNTLSLIREMLTRNHISGVFFIDVLLFNKIKREKPLMYDEIIREVKLLQQSNHSIEMLINLVWESLDDMHQMNKERLTDIFAQGKHLILELHEKAAHATMSIRVLNSKLQPFLYIYDIYQQFGIKIDASILPEVKDSLYFDFSSLKQGEIIRFSQDPNKSERYGFFLGIPRAYFKLGMWSKLRATKQFNKIKRKKGVRTFLGEDKLFSDVVSIPSSKSVQKKLLSPDLVPTRVFRKVMNYQHIILKDICVLESMLDTVNDITESNLKYLQTVPYFNFVDLKEVVKNHSTTYKIRLEG